MILRRPSHMILQTTQHPYLLIEDAGRVCYKSEGKKTPGSSLAFISNRIASGHESVLEHASMTVKFICDRGVSHELVRHRLASFSQESTRYCDYNKGHLEFIIPPWITDLEEGTINDCEGAIADSNVSSATCEWLFSMAHAERTYKYLREMGWSPQQARSILPNSLKTEIVMTANFREWRHIFKLRCDAAAHPQMREIMRPLFECCEATWPDIFNWEFS